MPRQGFACEEANIAGITSGAHVLARLVTLGAFTSRDAKATAIPAGCYWSHIDLQFSVTAGAPTTCQAMLWWDSSANNPASGITPAVTLQAGLSTTTLRCCAIGLDVWPSYPTAVNLTPGQLYMSLSLDTGTATLVKARLHWRDHLSGG